MSPPPIEFNPAKDAANKARHGIGLGFADHVFADPFAINMIDARRDYGEIRWRTLGAVEGRIYVVIHTEREYPDAKPAEMMWRCRIIPVRKANERETRIYRSVATKR
jgi:hypothetical protein